jgi:hypothetical protein
VTLTESLCGISHVTKRGGDDLKESHSTRPLWVISGHPWCGSAMSALPPESRHAHRRHQCLLSVSSGPQPSLVQRRRYGLKALSARLVRGVNSRTVASLCVA